MLQTILREGKVDLDTEDDIRKLLERGTVKTTTTTTIGPESPDADDDSEFSSTVVKTLTDTKLWKKVSAHASDWFETISIWVANKVEQDVKVLAALGLFAWERAVRDVARALPEAGQTGRKIMLLSNSSSYQEPSPVRAVLEDMNKPSEEILQVTRSILDILSGEKRTDLDRGLRTAAPAGTINSGERIRRAYKQRKFLERQSRDVARIPGAVVDTAFELKRELAAEKSRPGYKTANIRNAIGAGVSETSRLLQEVKEGARLAAAKKKTLRLKQAQATAKSLRDDIVDELRKERTAIAQRLRSCIKEPENTWLREEVVLASEARISFDQNSLRDVVMSMMLVRDDIESNEEVQEGYEQLVAELKSIRRSLEGIRGRAISATSPAIAEALWDAVIGSQQDAESVPLILKLDEIEKVMQETSDIESINPADFDTADLQSTTDFFASPSIVEEGHNTNTATFEFVDVAPEAVVTSAYSSFTPTMKEAYGSDDYIASGLMAELVSDDEFADAVGSSRQVLAVGEDDDKAEQENVVMLYTLRLLDIVFFVLEKTFTVAIPKSILVAETFSRRLTEVNQGGKGTAGWQQIRNLADPKGRY